LSVDFERVDDELTLHFFRLASGKEADSRVGRRAARKAPKEPRSEPKASEGHRGRRRAKVIG
jgi:hypothetical protein